jgi:hypothetical protein
MRLEGTPGWYRRRTGVGLIAGLLAVAACGDGGPTEPSLDVADIAGTYALTQLAFDPQGVLPEVDVLAAIGTAPQLIVTVNNAAQIVYQDPVSGLFTTIAATARTTPTGLRLDFNSNSAYAGLLLSRRMEFTFTAGTRTLAFDDDAPDGVNRQRLVQLVPVWANEQLLDPVPGRLQVTFKGQ